MPITARTGGIVRKGDGTLDMRYRVSRETAGIVAAFESEMPGSDGADFLELVRRYEALILGRCDGSRPD